MITAVRKKKNPQTVYSFFKIEKPELLEDSFPPNKRRPLISLLIFQINLAPKWAWADIRFEPFTVVVKKKNKVSITADTVCHL